MHLALTSFFRRTRPLHSCAAVIAGLTVAAGLLPACASNKAAATDPATQEAPKPQGYAGIEIDHSAWAKIGYRLDWVGYPFAGRTRKIEVIGMAVRDDAVIIQERSSTVTLMDSANGANRWSLDVASPLTKFTDLRFDTADPSHVLVASETELFTLDTATGNLVGRDDFSKVVNTAAVFDGNVAIFGTASGQVYAHNRVTGFNAWGFSLAATIESSPVRVGEHALGVVSQRGEVVFLTGQGQLLGRARIFDGLDTNPVSEGDRMFIAGLDQSLWAFESTGQLAWRFRTPAPLTVQPTVFDNVVYCEIPGSGLTAFDAGTGSVLWLAKDTSGTVIGIRSERLVVWNGTTITTLDQRDGAVVDRFDVPGIQRVVCDQFTDGVLYLVSTRGVVARLMAR